ncbi:hypothetical protein FRC07_005466 [Ceratobasidium sp. 392]|nr:hypothetical protein FRC07_005466 [Ceratobasidium sp. 392]
MIPRPRLPPEILNIIVSYSCPESYANLACLSRKSHRAFGHLLYRDMHIHTPRQLVKLFQSPNLARNLSKTRRLSIAMSVFLEADWEGVHRELEPAEHLGRILQLTPSLRELSLDLLYPNAVIDKRYDDFEKRFLQVILDRAASDPTFLSKLVRFECPRIIMMLPLCQGRSIESMAHTRDSDPALNPWSTHLHPAGASTSCFSASIVVDAQVGLFRESAKQALEIAKEASMHGLALKHLKITVDGPRDGEIAPIQVEDPIWWPEVISVYFGGHEQLESLYIEYDPPLSKRSTKWQRETIEFVARYMPSLSHAAIGSPDIEWGKYVAGKPTSSDSYDIPDWSPCPSRCNYDVLCWWLRRLDVDAEEVNRGCLERTAVKLRKIMLTRWDDPSVPSVQELQNRLFAGPLSG